MESEEVEVYIRAISPPESILREVRKTIREAVPETEESISYRIPYYSYKGRLAWFGLFTSHIGLFIRPPFSRNIGTSSKGR